MWRWRCLLVVVVVVVGGGGVGGRGRCGVGSDGGLVVLWLCLFKPSACLSSLRRLRCSFSLHGMLLASSREGPAQAAGRKTGFGATAVSGGDWAVGAWAALRLHRPPGLALAQKT